MKTKDKVKELLKGLPENASLEDVQYHLYVVEKVERGLADIRKGNVLSQTNVEKRMQKWIMP
jgi:predicted transcriptional regulator